MTESRISQLLHQLVSISSVSGNEQEASSFLARWMEHNGYERAYVDEAGNAVGERGARNATRTLVLLGHIDTVPGDIPVRVETIQTQEAPDGEPVLYGRGSVDAKGPLATFAEAVARIDPALLDKHDLRLVVVGAVEEESATSKGARFLARRFDGANEAVPAACIIGEPSRWHRVTLGYKGRLLIDLEAERELTHTAGPDPGVAVVATDLWQHLRHHAETFNQSPVRASDRPFDLLQPSVRSINTSCEDGFTEHVAATFGLRLPLDFDPDRLRSDLLLFAAQRTSATPIQKGTEYLFNGADLTLRLGLRGYERAWKGERGSLLARCFLRAIRQQAPDTRPGFVVKTGTSDMNVVAPVWRCEILAYGPGDSALDHTPEEHQPLGELKKATDVLETALGHWIEAQPGPHR